MKKTSLQNKSSIRKTEVSHILLNFSLLYFDKSDAEICPLSPKNNYIHALLDRLKDLSSWTAKDFINCRSKSIRAHIHDWKKTTRPKGFQHLHSELQSLPGWQFQLSANEHGRVHGILVGNIFYIIWLDQNHKLYK